MTFVVPSCRLSSAGCAVSNYSSPYHTVKHYVFMQLCELYHVNYLNHASATHSYDSLTRETWLNTAPPLCGRQIYRGVQPIRPLRISVDSKV